MKTRTRSVKSGSNQRIATEVLRITPQAKAVVLDIAAREGVQPHEVLTGLLPLKKTDTVGYCRNCEKLILNPAARGPCHEPTCVLFKAA